MRNLFALFAFLLGASIQTVFAVDTNPPTCKLLDTVISGSSGGGTTYFTYYIKAADETELAGYAIEYRAQVNNAGFGPWRPYNAYDPLYGGPLTITVQCTSFQFQVRAVDAAGNRSPIVTRTYAAPFPLTPAYAAPRFSAAQKVDGGGTTVNRVLAKFDFDADGTSDIAQCDHDSGLLKIRRNTEGDGKTFTDLDLPFTANTLDMIAGGKLVNKAGGTTNDALPDLAVANGGNISIEVNQGVDTGGALSFTKQITELFPDDGQGSSTHYLKLVSVADLNGDGFDDIVATGDPFPGRTNHVIAVFLNQNGTSGGFAAPVLIDSNLRFFYDLQVADLNGDGYPDVAVCGFATNGGGISGAVEIFLNDGTGHLTHGDFKFLSDYPSALALGDVTGDGIPDLAATIYGNFQASGTNVRVITQVVIMENKGDGTFQYLHQFPLADKVVPGPPRFPIHTSVAIGDTNFDGKGDIVAACDVSNVGKLFQLKNLLDPDDGSVFASLLARSSSLVFGGPVRALAFGDLDGNGKRDIFSANTLAAKPASVLLNVTPGVTAPTSFKFTVTGDTKPLDGFISGWDFNFSTVLAASATGLKLRVQSTLVPPGDPNREASWTDLPGGGYLIKSGVNNWKLVATNIPLGMRYFRVVASSDDFADKITKDIGPINITPPAYLLDMRFAEVTDTTPKVTTSAFKRSYTLKVERGNTGLLAVKVTNTGSIDKFSVKIPRSAIVSGNMSDHFRSLVSEEVDLDPFVLPAQPADTFVTVETPYLHHAGSYTFYLKSRTAIAAPEGELGAFDLTGTPSLDSNTHDTITAVIKASNPKNTFFVTNTNDTGAGSLRQALFDLQSHNLTAKLPAPDIKFEIPQTDPNYNSGVPTITLQSGLGPIIVLGVPLIVNNVTIDGNTQTDYTRFSGNPDAIVLIKGDSFDAFTHNMRTPKVNFGLDVPGGGWRIEHLIFADMETGIRLSGKSAKQNVIRGCGFLANHDAGILIEGGASKNLVGGSEPSYRNFFMAQQALFTFGSFGVWIRGNDTDGNKVQGNLIGEGLRNLGGNSGMGDAGVCIMDGAQGNLVGGTSSELRNVIVRNGLAANYAHPFQFGGVSISGLHTDNSRGAHTDGNLVQGNYIGVDEAGTTGAGNELGIMIWDGAKNNLIGGTDPGAGNVISGSSGNGISINGSASGNRIVGNIIGLDALGDAAIPNKDNGIEIDDASDNIVGGTTAASRNIISGNTHDGVHLVAHRTLVQGNYIGTDITGQFARGNAKNGVYILGGDDNVIGFGATSKGANIIAFNTGNGVYIDTAKLSGSNDLTGYRNSIRGNSLLGNGKIGIDLKVDPQTGGIEGNDGVNFNGTPKATDANEGLNHPNIQVAAVISARGVKTTNVVVSFDGVPNTKYAFDFYASDVQDPSGYGEGAQSLGYLERTTAPAGAAAPAFPGRVTFTGTISGDYSGKVITCTATRKNGADFGSTSEFSGAVGVTQQLTLTDDGDVNKYIIFNAFNGDYEFHNGGSIAAQGKGTITRSGNIVTLTHNASDRKIKATADLSKETGTASYQALPGTTFISITDTVQ
jgi:hypothetical protein